MNPKELSDNDDIATSLIVDPYLGFTSHKMDLTFKACHNDNVALKSIIENFISDQNYEKALKQLMKGEWINSKLQTKVLEEHVCMHIGPFLFFYVLYFH